jgi:hypothetical protein
MLTRCGSAAGIDCRAVRAMMEGPSTPSSSTAASAAAAAAFFRPASCAAAAPATWLNGSWSRDRAVAGLVPRAAGCSFVSMLSRVLQAHVLTDRSPPRGQLQQWRRGQGA